MLIHDQPPRVPCSFATRLMRYHLTLKCLMPNRCYNDGSSIPEDNESGRYLLPASQHTKLTNLTRLALKMRRTTTDNIHFNLRTRFPEPRILRGCAHPPITSRCSSLCGTMWGSLETSNAEDSLAAAVGWWLGEKILVAIATKNANYPMRRWLRFKIARNDRLVFQFLDLPWEYQKRIHVNKTSYIASVLPKFSLIWGLLSIATNHASTVSSSSTANIKTMLFGLDCSKIYQTC